MGARGHDIVPAWPVFPGDDPSEARDSRDASRSGAVMGSVNTLRLQSPPGVDEVRMIAVQRGDEAAWRDLFEAWRTPLFRFLQRRTGSRESAEEAFQETWLRLYRSRHSYDPSRPFKPWILRIAANAGHDARVPITADFHWIEPIAADSIGLLETLTSALAALHPRERVLLLLAVEGLTSEEAAEVVGISPGAVRMALLRARQRIQEAFDEYPTRT